MWKSVSLMASTASAAASRAVIYACSSSMCLNSNLSKFLHMVFNCSALAASPFADDSTIAFSNSANVLLKACLLDFCLAFPFKSMASVSCFPIRMIGFRLERGSWKIMAILSPRIW